MMKLSALLLLCLSHKVFAVRELGIRVLLNEGDLKEGAGGCSKKEFKKVTKALQKQAEKSDSFQLIEEAGRRELLNCGFICCGFPYGYCGIYQPACAGYPTWSSNQQYCNRRELSEGQNQLEFVDEESEMRETDSFRELKQDDDDSKKTKAERKLCRQLKKEALMAITSILDKIDDSCADIVLLPARLQCYIVE